MYRGKYMPATHTFKNFDPSYWEASGGSLITYNILGMDMTAYLFDPESMDMFGYSKDTYDLTLEMVSPFFSTFTAPNLNIPNANKFTLSSWQSYGWGGTVEEVQQNFDFFVLNNIGGIDTRINPESKPITTLLLSGTVAGTTYFIPLIRASSEGENYDLPEIDSGSFVGASYTVTEDGGSFSNTTFRRFFDGGTFV
jgi:hypothetical protein